MLGVSLCFGFWSSITKGGYSAIFCLAFPPPKGSDAFAPPNIGGGSKGRGGFAALRFPHNQEKCILPILP